VGEQSVVAADDEQLVVRAERGLKAIEELKRRLGARSDPAPLIALVVEKLPKDFVATIVRELDASS